jgi:hypothetical protein
MLPIEQRISGRSPHPCDEVEVGVELPLSEVLLLELSGGQRTPLHVCEVVVVGPELPLVDVLEGTGVLLSKHKTSSGSQLCDEDEEAEDDEDEDDEDEDDEDEDEDDESNLW